MANPENESIDFHQDINEIQVDEKSSAKSKIILTLSLISLWIPIIPSIIALLMVHTAREEILNSNGTLRGLKIIKWGKTISWFTIWINLIGAILLIIIYTTATPLLIEGCKQAPMLCPLIQQ